MLTIIVLLNGVGFFPSWVNFVLNIVTGIQLGIQFINIKKLCKMLRKGCDMINSELNRRMWNLGGIKKTHSKNMRTII